MWEYQTASFNGHLDKMLKSEKGLKKLGQDGWELVTIIGGISQDGLSFQGIAYFKRPIYEEKIKAIDPDNFGEFRTGTLDDSQKSLIDARTKSLE